MGTKQVKNLHIDTVYENFKIKLLLKYSDFYTAYIVLQGLPSYLISGPQLLCLHYSAGYTYLITAKHLTGQHLDLRL
jgi:hypothetical protein